MNLLDLPLVLVRDIIAWFVLFGDLDHVIHSRRVNRLFHAEVLNYCVRTRTRELASQLQFLAHLPESLSFQLILDCVGIHYRGCNALKLSIHVVTDDLTSRLARLGNHVARQDVLRSVCKTVLAVKGPISSLLVPLSEIPEYQVSRKEDQSNDIVGSSFVVAAVSHYTSVRDAMLLEGSRPCGTTKYFSNALNASIRLGDYHLFKELLEIGPCKKHKSRNRLWMSEALESAVRTKNSSMVEWLLDPRFKIKTRGRTYDAVVKTAVWSGNFRNVRALLDAHSEIPLSLRESICVIASISGNNELIAEMLEAGVDIDVKDRKIGYTPLGAAISSGYIDTAHFLLDRGASLVERTRLAQCAAGGGNIRMLDLLLKHGLDIQEVGFNALIATKDVEMAQFIFDSGLRLRSEVDHSMARSVLRDVARDGKVAIARWLILVLGVNPNCTSSDWYQSSPPILSAIQGGQPAMVKLLLELGATPHDNLSATPLVNLVDDRNHGDSSIIVRRRREAWKVHEEWKAKLLIP